MCVFVCVRMCVLCVFCVRVRACVLVHARACVRLCVRASTAGVYASTCASAGMSVHLFLVVLKISWLVHYWCS